MKRHPTNNMDEQANNPIDAEIRAWLKRNVQNKSDLSAKVGHSPSWLHKYINGAGHATIDDLIRIAGLLMGVDLPVLSEIERRLLRAFQALEESDQFDVMAYAEHRGRIARRGPSRGSSETEDRKQRETTRKARSKP